MTAKAEQLKQGRDTIHKLHPQTMRAIDDMPKHEMLFPWPLNQRMIYRHFREILEAAGLSSTSRDLFHKIHRMSYTAVAAEKGIEAATRHAGHSCDLSRYYLDPTKMKADFAANYLPRPQLGEKPVMYNIETAVKVLHAPTPPTVDNETPEVVPTNSAIPEPSASIPTVPVPPTPRTESRPLWADGGVLVYVRHGRSLTVGFFLVS